MALSSAGCQTVDRFVLGDGFECEAYHGDKRMVLYKDGEKFSRAECSNPLFVKVYTKHPTFGYSITTPLYEKCKKMLREKDSDKE